MISSFIPDIPRLGNQKPCPWQSPMSCHPLARLPDTPIVGTLKAARYSRWRPHWEGVRSPGPGKECSISPGSEARGPYIAPAPFAARCGPPPFAVARAFAPPGGRVRAPLVDPKSTTGRSRAPNPAANTPRPKNTTKRGNAAKPSPPSVFCLSRL